MKNAEQNMMLFHAKIRKSPHVCPDMVYLITLPVEMVHVHNNH